MNSYNSTSSNPSVAAPLRVGRPWIRTTFQLHSRITIESHSAEDAFLQARKTPIFWVKDKIQAWLPQEAWEGNSFRVEVPGGGSSVEAVNIPEDGVWSFRFEHPDLPFDNRPAVAGRTWTTDIALKKNDDHIQVGVRSFCASQPFATEDVVLTRPRVVVEYARRYGLWDQRKLSDYPWQLSSEGDLEELGSFLIDPARRLPVVMLTQPDQQKLGIQTSPYVLDPRELSKQLLGVAHVVTLPWDLGFKWTEIVGKQWSTYMGAVRSYMPGLDFENDSSAEHPSTFAEKIIFWKNEGDDRVGEGPFTDFLTERLFQNAAFKRTDWRGLLFLPEAKTRVSELTRQQVSDGSEWQKIYEEEIQNLRSKIEELEKEAEEYSDQAMQSDNERRYYKEENSKLRVYNESLRVALNEKSPEAASISIPSSYEEMSDWVDEHLTGRLVLHSRASRGIKDAKYEDVELVYKSLLLLANEYRDRCLGHHGAKERFEEMYRSLNLDYDRSISKTRANEQGDQYFVRFPASSASKRFLEWHLRKGTTKDNRYCLGIYFFWDQETQQVVVGWLPSHLDNRMT